MYRRFNFLQIWYPYFATLFLIVSVSFIISCNGGTPIPQILPTTAATPGPSGNWDACQYLSATAFGSLNTQNPDETSQLNWCDSYLNIVANGYVTTDNTGQAKMVNDGCTLYVYQGGDVHTLSDVNVSFCEQGDACAGGVAGCSHLTVTSLADVDVTFGSVVVIITDRKTGTMLFQVAEGHVNVKTKDGAYAFTIESNQAGYVLRGDDKQAALDLFGFEPGVAMDFGATAAAIEEIGLTTQIQQANLFLLRQKMRTIPLQVPYEVGIQWLTDGLDNENVTFAVAQSADIKPIKEKYFQTGKLTFWSKTGDYDLTTVDYKPDSIASLLQAAGVGPGQELILVYDGSIPGIEEMASQFDKNLVEFGGMKITLQSASPENLPRILTEVKQGKTPALFLGSR
jgi:hypothetical protein